MIAYNPQLKTIKQLKLKILFLINETDAFNVPEGSVLCISVLYKVNKFLLTLYNFIFILI